MQVFLNNCRRRNHAERYGADAFYDLRGTGRHATMLRYLQPGDECVVATPGSDNRIVFDWYAFRYETEHRDEHGDKFRVFCGEHLRSEQLDKTTATETEPYRHFFNVRGHFKQRSVIEQ